MCDSTLEELCAAWAGDASALEALAPAVRGSLTSLPLGARSTLTSLRNTPPATVAGSQSSCSCSTAGGHTMMSSSSSPYTVASAGRSSSGFGSAAGIERERELWETRAEAVTYAVQLRSLEHLTKRVSAGPCLLPVGPRRMDTMMRAVSVVTCQTASGRDKSSAVH